MFCRVAVPAALLALLTLSGPATGEICLEDEVQMKMCLHGSGLEDTYTVAIKSCKVDALSMTTPDCPKPNAMMNWLKQAGSVGDCLLSKLGIEASDNGFDAALIAHIAAKLPKTMIAALSPDDLEKCVKTEIQAFSKAVSKCKYRKPDLKNMNAAFANVAPMRCLLPMVSSACTSHVQAMIANFFEGLASMSG